MTFKNTTHRVVFLVFICAMIFFSGYYTILYYLLSIFYYVILHINIILHCVISQYYYNFTPDELICFLLHHQRPCWPPCSRSSVVIFVSFDHCGQHCYCFVCWVIFKVQLHYYNWSSIRSYQQFLQSFFTALIFYVLSHWIVLFFGIVYFVLS